ncbi:MAG: hypothetical protein IJP94_08375 [Clostridia bacterium]|nr:hypothetical protein [Clostridia bacterium]
MEKGEDMSKKDINIKSYDGQDAFYSGTDEEYKEFLKHATESLDMDGADKEPEPVDNTQKINLNETINLQNVIDKFKKTAGDIGQGAKAFKDNVVSKMDKFKTKMADGLDEAAEDLSEADDEPGFKEAIKNKVTSDAEAITEKITNSVKKSAKKVDELKGEMKAMADMPDKIDGVGTRLDGINGALKSISADISSINEQLEELRNALTTEEGEEDEAETLITGMAEDIQMLCTSVTDIRQSVGSVSKLNDSVFELKNNQLNTRNAVSNLETAFARLKKKCILGVTVVSVLSAIIIALEIVNILS